MIRREFLSGFTVGSPVLLSGESRLAIDPAKNIEVTEFNHPQKVKKGERAEGSATIESSASKRGRVVFEVRVSRPGSYDRETVHTSAGAIAPNGSLSIEYETERLRYETGQLNLWPYFRVQWNEREVWDGEFSDSRRVQITGGDTKLPEFEVKSVETNGPVVAGEELSVTVEMENKGDLSGERKTSLQLERNGSVLRSKTVTSSIGGGDSDEVSVSFTTPSDETGEYTLRVSNEDLTETETVTIVPEHLENGNVEDYVTLNLTSTDNEINVGDTTHATISAINTIASTDITLQLILQIPSNVSISGIYGANEGSDQVTAVARVDPGDEVNIRIAFTVTEPDTYEITGQIAYTSDIGNGQETMKPITITATPESARDADTPTPATDTDQSSSGSVPVFSPETTVLVGGAGYLLKRIRNLR